MTYLSPIFLSAKYRKQYCAFKTFTLCMSVTCNSLSRCFTVAKHYNKAKLWVQDLNYVVSMI